MENILILQQPVKELPFSEEFKSMAEISGFKNLGEVLSFPAAFLLQREGINYHLYKELADCLKKNKLLHLLKHQH